MSENGFLKLAGLASLLSAITTFFLWYLARQVPGAETFDEAAALHSDGPYMARQWVNLLHIPLALLAYIGASRAVAEPMRGWAFAGLIFFIIWGAVEMAGVAMNIFALNAVLRPAYLAADETTAAALRASIETLGAVWNGLFFVILLGFLCGTTLLGIALLKAASGLQMIVAWLVLAATPLTLIIMASGYAGMAGLDPVVGVIYPILQPVSRALMGVWLWRKAQQTR